MDGIVYLTASHGPDLDRLQLLRRSLSAVGDATEHHIVVHDEDLPQFRSALSGDASVRLHGTSEYLPAHYERGRFRSINRRPYPKLARSLLKRLGWRERIAAAAVSGWHYQQLTKFLAAAAMPGDCIVILDSDLVAVRKPRNEDYRDPTGRPHLLSSRELLDSTYYRPWLGQAVEFWRETYQRLGYSDPQAFDRLPPDITYVLAPVIWRRSAVRQLMSVVEAAYQQSFATTFITRGLNSEFYLYGVFCELQSGTDQADVSRTGRPLAAREIKELDRGEELSAVLRAQWAPEEFPFVWVQGFLGHTAQDLTAALPQTQARWLGASS